MRKKIREKTVKMIRIGGIPNADHLSKFMEQRFSFIKCLQKNCSSKPTEMFLKVIYGEKNQSRNTQDDPDWVYTIYD